MYRKLCLSCQRTLSPWQHRTQHTTQTPLRESTPAKEQTTLSRPTPQKGGNLNPMVVIPIACFALAYWQIERRKWKLELLEQIEEENNKSPAEFEPSHEYREYANVKTRGVYDFNYEFFLGPRHEIQLNGEQGKPGGYHSIVPMVLECGTRILVDRGWLPAITNKTVGKVTGTVEIVGRIRGPEPEINVGFRSLSPEATIMYYRDSNIMANASESLPVTIELSSECDVPGGPFGGQTRTLLYNKHAEYIFLWSSLGIVSLFYVCSFRRRPKPIPKVFM